MIFRITTIVSAFFLLTASADAHHSYAAEFDPESPATIEGVVSDEDGNEVTWDTRGLAPVKLVRMGWTKSTIKVGDKVKLYGHVGRENKHIMSIIDITLPDGRMLTSRSVAYDIKDDKE